LHDFRGLPLDCMVGYRHAFGYISLAPFGAALGAAFHYSATSPKGATTLSLEGRRNPLPRTDCRQLLPPCRVVDCRYHSPTLPWQPFLTVKEASRITGKSAEFHPPHIYPIIHDDKHPDRTHIQPTVEEAMQLRIEGREFCVASERRIVCAEKCRSRPQQRKTTKLSGHAEQDLLAMLQGELQIKNQQIVQQGELISKADGTHQRLE